MSTAPNVDEVWAVNLHAQLQEDEEQWFPCANLSAMAKSALLQSSVLPGGFCRLKAYRWPLCADQKDYSQCTRMVKAFYILGTPTGTVLIDSVGNTTWRHCRTVSCKPNRVHHSALMPPCRPLVQQGELPVSRPPVANSALSSLLTKVMLWDATVDTLYLFSTDCKTT